jgi:ABC-type nickel/cobalt efflux system permease component RcnA
MQRHKFVILPRAALLILILGLFLLARASTARAHPADIFSHSIGATISEQGISIKWEIKPGPMLASFVWHSADLDQDGEVSQEEADRWGNEYAPLLTASLNDQPFALQLDGMQFPSNNGVQAGTEFITFMFSTEWPQEAGNDFIFELDNGFDRKNSLSWFSVSTQGNAALGSPVQKASSLTVKIYRDRSLVNDASVLLSSWDSDTPSLPEGQQKDTVSQAAEQAVPELAQNTPQEILTGLVRVERLSLRFYLLAVVLSLALGALHALTPGHGKTVVAAYLVGTRGTAKHAIALGSVVTVTHTGSVLLLGLVTLVASQYFLPTSIIPILEIVSGLLIVGFGLYLLVARIQYWRKEKAHQHAHEHELGLEHHHDHNHDHDHGHGHSHEVPDGITWRSLTALGVSGGLVPCPDAIAILLVAIAINRIVLGLALILSFSLGLAAVLIVIGLAMVRSRRLFDKMDAFSRFTPILPILSAVAVLILGVALTYGAYARLHENAVSLGAGFLSASDAESFDLDRAQVLFLNDDENGNKQLFISSTKGEVKCITSASNGVIDYALSPDGTQIVYILPTEDLENEFWAVHTDGTQNHDLFPCAQAMCSQPVWSPDGRRLTYERMDLSGEGVSTGLPSLWWFDLESGETKPVFQDERLPGANPRWSPDGEWLSYATADGIRLAHLGTGENRKIESILGSPAVWSPDGRSLLLRDVLIKDNQYVTQIYLYDLSSGLKTNLNEDVNMENILAAWSPDGSQIAVVRRDLSVPVGDQIWIMRADGSDVHPITDAPSVLHNSLNWSPDGNYLLYDLYLLESYPLETYLQVLDTRTGEVTDLGIKGYNPTWLIEK